MWWVEAMSDSPPDKALEMQRRPTRSAPSVWKYCLLQKDMLEDWDGRCNDAYGYAYLALVR